MSGGEVTENKGLEIREIKGEEVSGRGSEGN